MTPLPRPRCRRGAHPRRSRTSRCDPGASRRAEADRHASHLLGGAGRFLSPRSSWLRPASVHCRPTLDRARFIRASPQPLAGRVRSGSDSPTASAGRKPPKYIPPKSPTRRGPRARLKPPTRTPHTAAIAPAPDSPRLGGPRRWRLSASASGQRRGDFPELTEVNRIVHGIDQGPPLPVNGLRRGSGPVKLDLERVEDGPPHHRIRKVCGGTGGLGNPVQRVGDLIRDCSIIRARQNESPITQRSPEKPLFRAAGPSSNRASVTEVSDSLIPSRVFGAACGHFIARYCNAKEYQLREARRSAIESGRPDAVSNSSPSRAACRCSCRRVGSHTSSRRARSSSCRKADRTPALAW